MCLSLFKNSMPIICKALPVFLRVVAISPSQTAIVWRQVASHKLCNFLESAIAFIESCQPKFEDVARSTSGKPGGHCSYLHLVCGGKIKTLHNHWVTVHFT